MEGERASEREKNVFFGFSFPTSPTPFPPFSSSYFRCLIIKHTQHPTREGFILLCDPSQPPKKKIKASGLGRRKKRRRKKKGGRGREGERRKMKEILFLALSRKFLPLFCLIFFLSLLLLWRERERAPGALVPLSFDHFLFLLKKGEPMALHARAWRAVIVLALVAWWCLAGAPFFVSHRDSVRRPPTLFSSASGSFSTVSENRNLSLSSRPLCRCPPSLSFSRCNGSARKRS